jgi:tripartite-type tricarboxylate transporter receptor subunit TctC
MGWERLPGATIWSLVPGTLIAAITIMVVLAATALHAGTKNASAEVFNPLDPMQLMVATAAGGLDDVLGSTDDKHLTSESMENVHVVLEHIPGRGVALVPV